jgi:cytochrome b561
MDIQAVAEIRKRGCLSVLLYIILLCLPIIGWIALFMLLRGRKSKTVSIAVCQSCGKRERL